MGILSGNPKNEPMHYGEVFGNWTALMGAQGVVACYQTFVNHTGDDELKELLKEAIKLKQQESEQIENLLKENGIGLPPAPPERPDANLEDIPAGARFLDQEIAATLAKDLAAGLVACSTMMGQSLREDIAMMYGQMHLQIAALGAKVLRLSKEKGWVVVPPLHHYHTDDC